ANHTVRTLGAGSQRLRHGATVVADAKLALTQTDDGAVGGASLAVAGGRGSRLGGRGDGDNHDGGSRSRSRGGSRGLGGRDAGEEGGRGGGSTSGRSRCGRGGGGAVKGGDAGGLGAGALAVLGGLLEHLAELAGVGDVEHAVGRRALAGDVGDE